MNRNPSSPVVPIDSVPPAEPAPQRPIILVVDDESVIADTLTEILSRNGYAAMAAYDAYDAIETALLTPPELLIADVMLPGMTGIDLAIKIKHIFPDCKVLLFSGQAETVDLLNAAARSGHRFKLLGKPIHPSDLLVNVSKSLGRTYAVAH
jgi:CheY-like chemotaxis protein